MENEILINYNHFVDTLLSDPSKDLAVLIARLQKLDAESDVNVSRIATATDGLCSEAGELKEILKKIFYQGKPLDDANIFHMKRELGDIIFYWMVACQALNMTAEDIIKENVNKLEARYPGGHFDVSHSEVRKVGDL